MPFDADSGPALQAQLEQDPTYKSLKQQFLAGGKNPQDWIALNAYVQRKLDAGGNNSRTGAVQVDGDGNVQSINRDNKWTSPATWGPIAVGGATAGLGLLANASSAPTVAASTEASQGVGPLATGLVNPATDFTIPSSLAPTAAADVSTGVGPLAGGLTNPATDYAIPSTLTNVGVPTTAASTPSYLKTISDIGQTATDISKGRADARGQEAQLTNQANSGLVNLYRAQIDSNNAQNQYGLNAANSENNFNTNAYGLDLNTANAANTFGLNKVNAGIGVGNLDLAQKNYALAAPGKRAANSVRGDILANAQDANITGLPSTIPKFSFSGGLRPSMFSANTRALGGELSSQALADQRKGDTFAPLPSLPNYQGPTSKLPTYKAPAPYVNPPPAPQLTAQPQANGLDTGLNIAGYAGLIAPYLKYFK